MNALPLHEYKSPRDWLKGKDSFSNEKRLKYLSSIVSQLKNPSRKNFSVDFEVMVKAGEKYFTSQEFPERGYFQGEDSRPRCIFNPAPSLCGLITYI